MTHDRPAEVIIRTAIVKVLESFVPRESSILMVNVKSRQSTIVKEARDTILLHSNAGNTVTRICNYNAVWKMSLIVKLLDIISFEPVL